MYRGFGRRFDAWINRKPHRGEHLVQAMIGVNVSDGLLALPASPSYLHSTHPSPSLSLYVLQMVAGIGLLTQVQRWRLGSFDEALDEDISVTRPHLWAQYEQGQPAPLLRSTVSAFTLHCHVLTLVSPSSLLCPRDGRQCAY
jgi:hypothetical protein